MEVLRHVNWPCEVIIPVLLTLHIRLIEATLLVLVLCGDADIVALGDLLLEDNV